MFAAAVVLFFGLGPTHGALADTPSTCSVSAGFDEQTASASQLAACGIIKVPLSGTVTLQDGGTMYDFQTPGGQTLYVPSTPPGFDGLTATAAEQAEYGIPPEPPISDTAAYDSWKALVTNWKLDPGLPEYAYGDAEYQLTACSSGCWGGYANTATGWTVAEAIYQEPGVSGTECSNDAVSFWSGVGGIGNNSFGQTGTTDGQSGWPNGTGWFETDPGPKSPPYRYPYNPAPVASTDASVNAITQWNINDQYYEFTLIIGSNEYVTGETGNWPSNATAEEIVEQPYNSSFSTTLTNYGSVEMSGFNGRGYSPLGAHPVEQLTTGGMWIGPLVDQSTYESLWQYCSS